jgi:hypothetical protein
VFELIGRGFKVLLIGHNAGFYDGHFLLKYIFSNPTIFHEIPKLITRGNKIYVIQTKSFKVIDSLNYFSTALSKLPTMFGFQEQKGFFPYLFNTNENLTYIGCIPDKKFFMPSGMKPNEKREFDEWWDNFYNSNIPYKACVNFYQNFKSTFGFNVFEQSLTIAAACNKIFRSNFLRKDSIGVIPLNGYRMRENQSVVALKWLYTEEVRRGITIEHAGNGREKKVDNYHVDGYYKDPFTHQEYIFEFLGCYWHSCDKCFPHIVNSDSIVDAEIIKRRENTQYRLQYLRSRYGNVVCKWECEFKHDLAEDLELSEIASSDPYTQIPPLNPRDAFYGGRTSTITSYHKVDDGEKIMYFDVCSLYPYINKHFKVPLGHPKLHVGDDAKNIDIATFEGIIKCRVLPPSDLFHPVLPFKMHKKLMFFLCFSCALSHSEVCEHDELQRSFLGTWVADEIRLAISKGYRVIRIHEAWEYQVETGVFKEYVNTFLKEKQEASGFPNWCDNEAKKSQYVRDYKIREGVDLDPSKIVKNPGKRSSAKLCLNSFWGKFGENPATKTKMEIVCDPHRFFQLLMDISIQINKVIVINELTLLVCFENINEACENLNTVNVAVAAFTTCGARIKLYSYLEQLQKRVLYMDTDSVIFTLKQGESCLELGDYLGDLTDELIEFGEGSYITEFVSGGPKNYAFQVFSPLTNSVNYVVKAKGFTLSHENLNVINFSSIKNMVLRSINQDSYTEIESDDDSDFLVTKCSRIFRKGMGNIHSREETKVYRINCGKRRLSGGYISYPWGYK